MIRQPIDQQLSHRESTALRYDQLLKTHVGQRHGSPTNRASTGPIPKSNVHLSQRLPPQQIEPESPLRLKRPVKHRNPSPVKKSGKRVSIVEPQHLRDSTFEEFAANSIEDVNGLKKVDARLQDDNYDWLHSPEADQFLASAQLIKTEDNQTPPASTETVWKENIASIVAFLRNCRYNTSTIDKPVAFIPATLENPSMRDLNLEVHSLREKLALEQNSTIHSCNFELKEAIDLYTKQLLFTSESCISELLDFGEEERQIRQEIEGSHGLIPQIKKSVAATEIVMKQIDSTRYHIAEVKAAIDALKEQLLQEFHTKERTQLSAQQVLFAIESISTEIKTASDIKELLKSREQNSTAALHFVEVFSLRLLKATFQALRRFTRQQRRIAAFRTENRRKHRLSVLQVCYRLWRQCVRTVKCGKILTKRVLRKCGRSALRLWFLAFQAKHRVALCDDAKPVARLHLRRAFQFLRKWKNNCKQRRRITDKHGLYVTLFTVVRVFRCWRQFNLQERERVASMWLELWNNRLRRLMRAWQQCIGEQRRLLKEKVVLVLGLKKRNCFRKYFGSWTSFHRFRCHLLVYKRKQLGLQAFKRAAKSFGKQSRASQRVRLDCIQRLDVRTVVPSGGEKESPQRVNRRVLHLTLLRIHFRWFCRHIRAARKLTRAKEIVARRVIHRLASRHFDLWYQHKRIRAHVLHKMERAVASSVGLKLLHQSLKNWYFLWQCGPDEIKPAKLRQHLKQLRQQNAVLADARDISMEALQHNVDVSAVVKDVLVSVGMATQSRRPSVQQRIAFSTAALEEDHCYPFEDCDDDDDERALTVVDNNLDVFGQLAISNLASFALDGEDEVLSTGLFTAHKIWLRAALHRWQRTTERRQRLLQKGDTVKNLQDNWQKRRVLSGWHGLWLASAARRFKTMTTIVGRESQLEDDSKRYEFQVAKESVVEKIQQDKELSDALQLQIDELEASLSQVCLELDSIHHIERDIHASLVVLNRQNQQACERHAALLERCKALQDMREQVLLNQAAEAEGNGGIDLCLPRVEALNAEHHDNRFLLMRDVENLYQRAVQTQTEMVKQREAMTNKSKSVKRQIKQDSEELWQLEAAIDRLTRSRVATENSLRSTSSTLESAVLKLSEESKCRDVKMEQLDAEKLALEEKLTSLYEMESKMRSHIEQFSPSLLPAVPSNGRYSTADSKQSYFNPAQLAECELLSLDYLNSSTAITEAEDAPATISFVPLTSNGATQEVVEDLLYSSAEDLLKATEHTDYDVSMAQLDKENVRNYSGYGSSTSTTAADGGAKGGRVHSAAKRKTGTGVKGLKKRVTTSTATLCKSGINSSGASGGVSGSTTALVKSAIGAAAAAGGGKGVKRIEDQIDAIYQRIANRLSDAPV